MWSVHSQVPTCTCTGLKLGCGLEGLNHNHVEVNNLVHVAQSVYECTYDSIASSPGHFCIRKKISLGTRLMIAGILNS